MASPTNGFTSLQFSTETIPIRNRLDDWRELYGRTMFQLDIDPLQKEGYRSEAKLTALPGFGIAEVACSGAHYRRTRALIDSDDLCLWVSLAQGGVASQRGREVTLGTGDAVLMATEDIGVTSIPPGARSLAFRVPYKAIASKVADLDAVLFRRVPTDTGAMQLLMAYSNVLRDRHSLDQPELQQTLVTHLSDLTVLALGATRDGEEQARVRGVRAARLRVIKEDIAANLDGDLSIAAVAGRHAVSPRSVQIVFEAEGTTFTDYVLGQKLARAHRMLCDPRRARQNISTVAFDAGFGDLSYFNKVFRRRFGAVPSEIREAAAVRDWPAPDAPGTRRPHRQ
ncbi:AraC family transcriptional regulator [Mesorhizobium sp. CN2-181]|uniref:AraC family transcriptional regulator n=1 Tax=Mesorhizobium yinganensis TaxID=3157707 RepID=UPI0032B862F4